LTNFDKTNCNFATTLTNFFVFARPVMLTEQTESRRTLPATRDDHANIKLTARN
jgi:hypothetical protein